MRQVTSGLPRTNTKPHSKDGWDTVPRLECVSTESRCLHRRVVAVEDTSTLTPEHDGANLPPDLLQTEKQSFLRLQTTFQQYFNRFRLSFAIWTVLEPAAQPLLVILRMSTFAPSEVSFTPTPRLKAPIGTKWEGHGQVFNDSTFSHSKGLIFNIFVGVAARSEHLAPFGPD
ncbi:hypothetical protein D9619_000087 [Psilocybe cf. subviscida]|uniref:Uncharacterized protein n=1 Tax=Psilocybe cf. subviscida TaxID=2480587 RepID=A0A8H5BE81_9AGAR|nr:hypothetical protein D9619_000087 [Psilocybe cf. subviscida]